MFGALEGQSPGDLEPLLFHHLHLHPLIHPVGFFGNGPNARLGFSVAFVGDPVGGDAVVRQYRSALKYGCIVISIILLLGKAYPCFRRLNTFSNSTATNTTDEAPSTASNS